MRSPIDKLRSYALRYHKAHFVDDGFLRWRMNSEQNICARVAAKAIELGLKVTYYNRNLIVHY